MNFYWLLFRNLQLKAWLKAKKRLFLHSFSPTWRETAHVLETTTTTNQKTEFAGVQSIFQSKENYRRNNIRLEMKFFKKIDKIRLLSRFFSANSFYILNWRSYIKNLVRNTFNLKILKNSISSLCILMVFYFWGPWCFERLMKKI